MYEAALPSTLVSGFFISMKIDGYKLLSQLHGLLREKKVSHPAAAMLSVIHFKHNSNFGKPFIFCASTYAEDYGITRQSASKYFNELLAASAVKIVGYVGQIRLTLIDVVCDDVNDDVKKVNTVVDTYVNDDVNDDVNNDVKNFNSVVNTHINKENTKSKIKKDSVLNTRTPDFQIQKNEGVSYFENPTTKRMQECDLFQQYRTNANFIISALRNIPAIAKYLTHENAQTTITELHNEFKFNNGATSQHPNTNEWFKHFQNFCKLELNRRAKESAQANLRPKTRAEFVAEVAKGIDDAYRAANQQPFGGQSEIDIEDADFQIIS